MNSRTSNTRQLNATVSGSFHRHMEAIGRAVHELAAHSVRVLSPADPRIVAHQGEFLFVASDRIRSVRLVQDRHLESIRAADFLWLVCPDGYLGQSASMEVGFAAAVGVPIFARHSPADLTLRQYVSTVPRLADALEQISSTELRRRPEALLIDPHASTETAHDALTRVERALRREEHVQDPTGRLYKDIADLKAMLSLPGSMR